MFAPTYTCLLTSAWTCAVHMSKLMFAACRDWSTIRLFFFYLPVFMYESIECQATPPAGVEIFDTDSSIPKK